MLLLQAQTAAALVQEHWCSLPIKLRKKIQTHEALVCDPNHWARVLGEVTPIYSVYRDVPPVRVSFSGSSVTNRVYNFTFLCRKQGRPRKSPFLPFQSHNFCWFCAPSLKCVKMQTCTVSIVLNTGQEFTALSLRQGSKINIFCVLNRVKVWLSWPNPFLLSTPPPPSGLEWAFESQRYMYHWMV